jgi:hypothetical protein
VCSGDVLLLLGFGLHLVFAATGLPTATAEVYAVFQDMLEIFFLAHASFLLCLLSSRFYPFISPLSTLISGGTASHR